MTVYETTNHNTIYHWATARGLWPASVAGEPTKIRLGGDPDANLGEDLAPIEMVALVPGIRPPRIAVDL